MSDLIAELLFDTMWHVVCTSLRPGHWTVYVGDSVRCSEAIVKHLGLHFFSVIVIIILLSISYGGSFDVKTST